MPKGDGPREASGRATVNLFDRSDPPARMVYVQIRQRVRGRKTEATKGLSIRAFDFTPEEVYRLVLKALREEAAALQRLKRARDLAATTPAENGVQ